jgi:hypothetical protein
VISKEGKIYKRYVGTVANKEEKIKQDVEHLLAEESPVPPKKITSGWANLFPAGIHDR